MNTQEVINEFKAIINIINANKDKFIDGFDGKLLLEINHSIKVLKTRGVENEENNNEN